MLMVVFWPLLVNLPAKINQYDYNLFFNYCPFGSVYTIKRRQLVEELRSQVLDLKYLISVLGAPTNTVFLLHILTALFD